MSINGERIGNRLIKRHGFDFHYHTVNFTIHCDRFDVARNNISGEGAMQWVLDDCGPGVDALATCPRLYISHLLPMQVGACHAASKVLTWKYWEVSVCDSLSFPDRPIIWIEKATNEDCTTPHPNKDFFKII